jgi:single-stranded-DNA-specific exonuclease
MRWDFTSKNTPQTLPELEKLLLENRKINDEKAFFTPPSPLDISLEDVQLDPTQIEKAVARIHQAAKNKEDVLIFGDYDADGVCATAILWEALRAAGVIARPFIPHREQHGYGLNARSLAAVLAAGPKPDLLISVDNGIVAHSAFAELKAQGVETILTDHHLPEKENGQPIYPPADIIVHSTKLCGSTVAWFLGRSLSPAAAAASLDLTAIATVADQMILLEANRSFVHHGLTALAKTQRVGLQQLMAKTMIDPAQLDVNSIHYGIAPRINAMGRLKHSIDALRLVCTTSPQRAAQLVEELHQTNATRQELTSEMIDHAMQSAQRWRNEHIIIVASSEYHEGVIGLIAGKLTETFYKPAIAIAINGELAKASARSVPGVNIIELIRLVKDDLLEAGGHPMAAGFGLLPAKIERVQQRLEEFARDQILATALEPCLSVECELPTELLSLATCEVLEKFAPFGNGNPEPVFALSDLQVVSAQQIGKDGRHLKLSLQIAGAEDGKVPLSQRRWSSPGYITALAWGMGQRAQEFSAGQVLSFAAQVNKNVWKGKESLQLVVKDILLN